MIMASESIDSLVLFIRRCASSGGTHGGEDHEKNRNKGFC